MTDERQRAPEEEEAKLLAEGFVWNEVTQSYWAPPEVEGFEEYGGSFENFLAGRKVAPQAAGRTQTLPTRSRPRTRREEQKRKQKQKRKRK
jgi:hypothetical protein